jgi:hypothetical protein
VSGVDAGLAWIRVGAKLDRAQKSRRQEASHRDEVYHRNPSVIAPGSMCCGRNLALGVPATTDNIGSLGFTFAIGTAVFAVWFGFTVATGVSALVFVFHGTAPSLHLTAKPKVRFQESDSWPPDFSR